VTPRDGLWGELRAEAAHGLLGQTWELRKGKDVIEGIVDDYLINDADVFSENFLYNKFSLKKQE